MTDLPALCYAKHPTDGRAVIIVRGEVGFRDFFTDDLDADLNVDRLNAAACVSKAQAAAMLSGSMFGWDVPAANPNRYDEHGRPR